MRGARQLKAQVERLACGGVLTAERVTDWSSLTFSGARHRFTFRFGSDRIEKARVFIDALPDHDFHLWGALVIEGRVMSYDYDFADRINNVTVEILTVNA